jgi:NAD(P)-dependent dehydrogenase (short-subunit alcohol dehydrogenase family)
MVCVTGVARPGVIVTGAAEGIGLAIAQAFENHDYRVHICDVEPDRLRAAVESSQMRGTLADVSCPADVDRLFAEARAWLGPIGVLVNNVGIAGPRAALEDIDLPAWDETFRINVAGALRCMQAAAPEMKARRAGVIINISTASTRTLLPMRSAYVASKYAVEGLTRNAARELGPYGVRCNALLPGIMNNPRMDAIISQRATQEGRPPEEVEAEFLSFVSLRSRTEPSDVGEAAVFLASPAAARITGELISVSGNLEWEQ